MLAYLRCFGVVVSALALGCGPSVVEEVSAGSSGSGSGSGSAGAGGSGAGGAAPMLKDPGVRLSQGEPCCIIQGGTGTCCTKPAGLASPGSVGPWEIVGIADAVEVTFGPDVACVRRATGNVACWGWNHLGQLGLAVDLGATAKHPTELPKVLVNRLVSGDHTVCGIESSGQAICWGAAPPSQLPSPPNGVTQAPLDLPGVPHAVDVALATNRGCVARADGSVLCWGWASPLAAVPGIDDAVKIAACEPLGMNPAACAARADGSVVCWSDDYPPTPVAGLQGVVQLSGSTFGGEICARTADGRVLCMSNDVFQPKAIKATPIDVHDATDLSTGYSGVCAVREDGSVACWDHGGNPTPFPLSNL